jgi:hypothetical protein
MSELSDYLIPVTFAGLPVSAWQDSEINYAITVKEVQLYSGDIHASLSPKKRSFPRSFDCYTEDYTEIENLVDQIGNFDTLVINGENFADCYISVLGGIKEVVRGSGKFVYNIKFSQADQH